jgi:hypothetical protein
MKSAERFAPWLPNQRFLHRPDRCFRATLQPFVSLSTGTRSSQRLFAHPQRPLLFTRSIPGSTFPACCFASLRLVSEDRSAFGSTTGTGWPRSGGFSASARFLFRAALHQLLSPISTPLQDFYSLRIAAFNRVSRWLVRPANAPDLLSLPGFVSISSSETGSPFLVRYAFTG